MSNNIDELPMNADWPKARFGGSDLTVEQIRRDLNIEAAERAEEALEDGGVDEGPEV